jgi:HK97 family phage major capsid protein
LGRWRLGAEATTAAAWSGIYLNAEEIATIVPIPEAVLDDASFDVWTELQGPIAQSIAAKIDAAVFAGTEKPATWPEALIPGAVDVGTAVPASSDVASGGIINDLGLAVGMVETAGYEASGYAASRALRPLLRGARSTTGEPLAAVGDSFSLDTEDSVAIPDGPFADATRRRPPRCRIVGGTAGEARAATSGRRTG